MSQDRDEKRRSEILSKSEELRLLLDREKTESRDGYVRADTVQCVLASYRNWLRKELKLL